MEMNVIKCPNCGASSTNHTNCEYCGSLLVRFVDKGIDLTTTSYLTNDKVYAGLIEALQQNLDRQDLSDSAVETGIFYKSSPTVKLSRKRHGVATVFRSGSTTWSDGDPINLGDKNRGLVIKFSFDIHAEENDASDERIERQHQEFKALGSFPLFTSHSGIYMRPGSSSRFRSQEYAIDFGQDVEGAARLISEVLSMVYGIPEDAQLIYLGEGEEIPVEKKNEEPLKEIVQSKDFSLFQKIGLGVAALWVGLFLFGSLISGWVVSILIHIGIFVAFYYIIEEKWDRKFLWPVVIGALVLSFITIGVSTDRPQNEQNSAEQKVDNSKEKEQNEIREETKKKDKIKNTIKDEAYNEGCSDAYGAVETVQDLIRSGYTKENIKGMQKTQGRLNYKEKYGEPKNSEERTLQELYGEKYAEGFMKTMFKN